jgi:hypothetical protein
MDTTFKVTRHEINAKLGHPVNLHFWGDVHFEADACNKDKFIRFVQRTAKIPNSLFVGMGDYHDFASAKEQAKLHNSELHDQTYELFDSWAQTHNRKFAEILSPMRGKLIGLLGGNHTWKLQNGYYADEDLAQRMDTKYLGWLSVIVLNFKTSRCTRSLKIVACHGRGGGKLVGSSINGVDDLRKIFPSADVFVMGHDHQRGAWPAVSLDIETHSPNPFVKAHEQWLVRSGSFLKSYEDGRSQYTTKGLYRPSSLGAVSLSVTIDRHREQKQGREEIDLFEFSINATT